MQLLMVLYLIAVCSIVPLYMNRGYYELGEAKASCFIAVSLCFFALYFLALLSKNKDRTAYAPVKKPEPMQTPELCLYGTLLSGFLSFAFSVDKRTAFLGMEGWRCGFLSLLLMFFAAIVFSRLEKMPVWVAGLILLVPFFEFVLGITNRFGISIMSFGGADSGYLATIGNINWYAGFLSVFVPLGVGIMFAQKPFSKLFFLSGIYVIPGITAIFLQGSDGALLIVIACYVLLAFISLTGTGRESLKRYLIQFFVLGMGMAAADLLLVLFGSLYTYEENLLTKLVSMRIGIVIMAAAFFLYRLVRLLEEINVSYRQALIRRIILAAVAISSVLGIIVFYRSFSDEFGNGRGIIWRMCSDIFLGLSPWQKLVGVGQDCLYPYAMKDPAWNGSFFNVFGADVLTNAHCELLTVLIERGLIGASLYLGLFISVICNAFTAKEKENAVTICILPVFSYFIYSQISFSQMVSTPYVYILLGFSIAFTRKQKSRELRDGN
ncbi:MAG: hypothetical protein K6F75_01625 [Butyrivibrio sp.]|nr:hypothetical protein [Butyrivibrio sp.]